MPALPEAKLRGYKPGRFSFNVKGGRCEACAGDGIIRIEMHFLPDVYVPCDVCKGTRYNRETLDVKYKGKSIAEVLDMTVAEALEFMENIPGSGTSCRPSRSRTRLYQAGPVGHHPVGRRSAADQTGHGTVQASNRPYPLYPGRADHRPAFRRHRKLLEVLDRLVETGNTIVIIEHNLDVIKTADYLIDLGPEGGERGGYVVAAGTPEEVAAVTRSYTGQFLRKML